MIFAVLMFQFAFNMYILNLLGFFKFYYYYKEYLPGA